MALGCADKDGKVSLIPGGRGFASVGVPARHSLPNK